jgi:hypothetical protein
LKATRPADTRPAITAPRRIGEGAVSAGQQGVEGTPHSVEAARYGFPLMLHIIGGAHGRGL